MKKLTRQGAGEGRQGEAQAHANPNAEKKEYDPINQSINQYNFIENHVMNPQEG